MAEFDELRDQLRQARAEKDKAGDDMFAAREKLRRIAARQAALDRVFDPHDREHLRERERLAGARAEAEVLLRQRQGDHVAARLGEQGLFASFARLTDPRQAIEQWNDQIPILLLPVRLETRFKTVTEPATGAKSRQLWVRIFPDACSLDTFEPTLSETEVKNAKLYWTGIWEAGGDAEQERGAWRGLVEAHGDGRAEWIITHYKPKNDAPVEKQPHVILTIPTETPPGDTEREPLAAFWIAVWRADGDKDADEAARAKLEGAVGAPRAAELVAQHKPVNFAAKPAPPLTRDQAGVSVEFVIFPVTEDLDLKRHSWSRAPRTTLLPDRFLFLGYADESPPVIVLGHPVPSPLIAGLDPSAPKEEQLQPDADGEILVPDEMRWMVDFDRAVEVGMGFRIPLDPVQAQGFDRVLVIGLRLSADETASQRDLEAWIEHHRFSRAGFSLVPQGTPTNNTDAGGSGWRRGSDADLSFDNLSKASLFDDSADWLEKRDGQWLAEYLGIDAAVLEKTLHSDGRDQADARAMNVALWPATLGYWMETMMQPVFSPQAVERTRGFFNRFITGRGAVPAVRIGSQPYGILPATALSRMRWMERKAGFGDAPRPESPLHQTLRVLYPILLLMDEDWRQMAGEVSFAGKPGDPHKTLLDVVGLHPGSVEHWQRYAEDVLQLFNRLNLAGLGKYLEPLILQSLQQIGTSLLERFGVTRERPDILDKFFFSEQNLLSGPLIDDRPLSETEPVRPYTADGKRNYLQWLIDATRTSLDALYLQDGFKDSKLPQALLYLLLRHALQLGYHDVSVRLYESAGLLSAEAVQAARRDEPFLHIRAQAPASESRYRLLTRAEPAITGSPTLSVGDFIGSSLHTLSVAVLFNEQVAALEKLKNASTARLERALTEHVDCCTYRLDAWLLGLVHVQLAEMRNLRDGSDVPPRKGLYLGAYAWLEEVRPEDKVLTPVEDIGDPQLAEYFHRPGEPPLTRDSANQGYIHAPSLNQAVAAAVLRNGYISNASPENRRTMAVNLTSERVRTALAMIEGIRAGQSLGALLGYQFERGLHDRHGPVEVDRLILDLRKAFPLRGNRMASTRPPEGVSIDTIEARNVIDGLALVSHIRSTGHALYPFGKSLPDISPAEADAVNAEVDRLRESHDAVADLAMAEGVYQTVLGNYDRAAATYDTYSKANFPPEPQVVRTPASGIGLTHRVGLHLAADADPNVSPLGGLPMTPRARTEPALNGWLATVLPPLKNVACRVSFLRAADNVLAAEQVTLHDLHLQPVDLLHLVRGDNEQAMSELDDRIVCCTIASHALRPDEPVQIDYMKTKGAPVSVFEVMPLMRHLRRLTQASRPLRPTDLALADEAKVEADAEVFVDAARLAGVQGAMQGLRAGLDAFAADLEALLADLPARRGDLIANVDNTVTVLATLLAEAAQFVIPETGWGFAYDFQRRVFRAVLAKCADLAARWNERLTEFDGLMLDYAALPPTAADAEKFALLVRAERLISTQASPLPATPDLFKTDLETNRRDAFTDKLADLQAIQDTHHTTVAELLAQAATVLPIDAFELAPLSFAEEEDEAVRFAEDVASLARVVLAEVDRRLAAAQGFFSQHEAAARPAARVKALEQAAKALLGDEFVIIPELSLGAGQAGEIEKAVAAGASSAFFDHLTDSPEPTELPVDTWLYGVARVRDAMRAWEQVVMLAGAFGRTEPELTPVQLPFLPGDRWLALEVHPEAKLDTDRLLYTACFHAPFDKTRRQCGLLLDEWTEVIPASDATTGITFHYDRPSCEPPQTMLLVTPTDFRGAWQWEDLVDALHETLDLAKRRAVEPVHIDKTLYARFLPATVIAVTINQLTISANLILNNELPQALEQD